MNNKSFSIISYHTKQKKLHSVLHFHTKMKILLALYYFLINENTGFIFHDSFIQWNSVKFDIWKVQKLIRVDSCVKLHTNAQSSRQNVLSGIV